MMKDDEEVTSRLLLSSDKAAKCLQTSKQQRTGSQPILPLPSCQMARSLKYVLSLYKAHI
jgi:hypothetical protein